MSKGLFVDLDGTLADSLAVLREAYFSFLSKFGAEGSLAEFERLNGPSLPTIVECLRETYSLSENSADLMTFYSQLLQQGHGSAPPAAGALMVLRQARSRGWKVAVVTSSPRHIAIKWIERVGFKDHVDTVVGGDEVNAGKPSPAPYQLAISRLECVASQSLAVEDSRLGACSAVAAGLPTLAIAEPADRADWPTQVKFINRFEDIIASI
jgi:HAD superfamily hydrolase (TIGR01509 family)